MGTIAFPVVFTQFRALEHIARIDQETVGMLGALLLEVAGQMRVASCLPVDGLFVLPKEFIVRVYLAMHIGGL